MLCMFLGPGAKVHLFCSPWAQSAAVGIMVCLGCPHTSVLDQGRHFLCLKKSSLELPWRCFFTWSEPGAACVCGEKSGKGVRKGCEEERKVCSVQPNSRDKFEVKTWGWRVSSSVRLSAFVLNP